MTQPNRWTNSEQNGSMFHEIVVLPTFAPQLARPEHQDAMPGGPILIPQPRSQLDQAGSNVVIPPGVPAAAGGTPPVDEDQDAVDELSEVKPERMFFVVVTVHKTLPPVIAVGGRSLKAAPKQAPTTKDAGQFAVLLLTRQDFINTVVFRSLGGVQYTAGVSGPAIKVWWTGSGGGERGAPTINSDSEWQIMIGKLALTTARVTSLHVSMDGTDSLMSAFLTSSAPLAPQGLSGALLSLPAINPPPSTQVPTLASFTQREQDMGLMTQAIRTAHQCGDPLHPACFKDEKSGKHYVLSRFRERQFSDWILADSTRNPTDSVPQVLLDAWDGRPVGSDGPTRPRGRHGSRPSADLSGSGDFSSMFAQGMGMMAGMMSNAMSSTSAGPVASSPSTPSSTQSIRRCRSDSFDVRSSSPPIPDEEMNTCVERYAKRRNISPSVASTAKDGLSDGRFFPEDLIDLDVAAVSDITGLAGGDAIGLKRYASSYAELIKGKRVRRKLD